MAHTYGLVEASGLFVSDSLIRTTKIGSAVSVLPGAGNGSRNILVTPLNG